MKFLRYAESQGIQVSVKELQQGIDDFRRKNGLLQVAAATEWLQRNRMTLDDLGECVREKLIESKLMHIIRIIVLDQGVVVESGTHEELLQAKGLYYYLVSQQL